MAEKLKATRCLGVARGEELVYEGQVKRVLEGTTIIGTDGGVWMVEAVVYEEGRDKGMLLVSHWEDFKNGWEGKVISVMDAARVEMAGDGDGELIVADDFEDRIVFPMARHKN